VPKLGLLEQWIETTPSGRINPYWLAAFAFLIDFIYFRDFSVPPLNIFFFPNLTAYFALKF
jgi:hypothetical protein